MVEETLIQDVNEILPGVVADRRHLHQHPELGFEEHATAEFVKGRLEHLGVEDIRTGIAETGITGLVRGTKDGPGRIVLLRADMDALPIDEETGTEFASQNPGVMHACGHDAHTAMLLGVARLLMDRRDDFSGTVKLLFQPSEEQGTGGALPMIDEGVLEDPHVDAVFGQHVASEYPTGEIHVSPGPISAAADFFEVVIQGKGGHGASPHQTVDPIIIATNIINALQTIVSRGTDPMDAVVVTVGSIHGGNAGNVIPDKVTLTGTVRTFTPESRDATEDRFVEIVESSAKMLGGSARVDYIRGYPSSINDEAAANIVRDAAIRTLGEDAVHEHKPMMSAEDFSYFLQQRPGAFFMTGTRNEEKNTHWPHHHPKFDVDEDGFVAGIATMVQTTIDYLNSDH